MARVLFFRMVLRKFSKITNNKPSFTQYNMFYNYEDFSLESAFWSLFNHRQRSQSNQKNVVCVVVRLVVSPCIDLYFLCEYLLYLSVINFTPIIRVFVIEKQSLVKLICIWYKQIERRTGVSHPLWERRRPF